MPKPPPLALPAAPSAPRKVPMLQPLRHARYRQLWIANLISNLGTWTQTFAAAWLMASISRSPLATTLVQTAAYAPLLMFGLLAGVVADAVPRPRLLWAVNACMALAAAGMALLAHSPHPLPWGVLALTFMLGTGSAFMWPAWQATTSSLVEAHEVEAAASLNNLSYNAAATLGPALGGVLFQWIGPAPLFLFNALSFGGLLLVYRQWIQSGAVPRQWAPINLDGFHAGRRAAFGTPAFRRLLGFTVAIFFCAVAYTALLPLYVRDVLQREAGMFGTLMACLGIGAVLAAFVLPELRARWQRWQLLGCALLLFGTMLLVLPWLRQPVLLMPLVVLGGMAWSTTITTLNSSAQLAFPSALRARTLSIYLMAMALGQTLGSLGWGRLAMLLDVPRTLMLAGACTVLLALRVLGQRRW